MRFFGTNNIDTGSGAGFVAGPNFVTMSAATTTGTIAYNSDYAVFPGVFPTGYNNGAGATKMLVFAKDKGGLSDFGITSSSTFVYSVLSGLSATSMQNIWKSSPAVAAYSCTFFTRASNNLRGSSGFSGTVYILGNHGSSSGVHQWVAGASSNVNTNLVFEYKPQSQTENGAYTDPNHYWMVDSGESSACNNFRGNNQYGNGVSGSSAATGVLGVRYGGIAVF